MNDSKFFQGSIFAYPLDISSELMENFGALSGDRNALHVDAAYARDNGFETRVAYGNILGMMVSHLVGMKLPTERVLLLQQSLDFKLPVYPGDHVTLQAEVVRVHEAMNTVEFKLSFFTGTDRKVATGKCVIKRL